MTRVKAIIILSGGLDSSVALHMSKERYDFVLALTFDYGQRAARKEEEAAQKFCKLLNIPHRCIEISWLKEITRTALVNSSEKLPELQKNELDNMSITLKSASAVWVPNRNGVFINIAASFAESLSAQAIISGFNAEEADTFPDNSEIFVKQINESLFYSTQNHCFVEAPTISMNKIEIVKEALKMKFPFEYLWSCYEGGEKMCGKCESCLRSKRAYLENKLESLVKVMFV